MYSNMCSIPFKGATKSQEVCKDGTLAWVREEEGYIYVKAVSEDCEDFSKNQK